MSWVENGPVVTVLSAAIRSLVARMWPRCGPSGHKLGRRAPPLRLVGMPRRWRRSGAPGIDHCCPWTAGGHCSGTWRARPVSTTWLGSNWNGLQLDRRVRPVFGWPTSLVDKLQWRCVSSGAPHYQSGEQGRVRDPARTHELSRLAACAPCARFDRY
jgi:hypothetical protein